MAALPALNSAVGASTALRLTMLTAESMVGSSGAGAAVFSRSVKGSTITVSTIGRTKPV